MNEPRLAAGLVTEAQLYEALAPHLGSDMALVVDLPPIDRVLETMHLGPDAAAVQMLAGVGYLRALQATVRPLVVAVATATFNLVFELLLRRGAQTWSTTWYAWADPS